METYVVHQHLIPTFFLYYFLLYACLSQTIVIVFYCYFSLTEPVIGCL
jgi:hypothetical protein